MNYKKITPERLLDYFGGGEVLIGDVLRHIYRRIYVVSEDRRYLVDDLCDYWYEFGFDQSLNDILVKLNKRAHLRGITLTAEQAYAQAVFVLLVENLETSNLKQNIK